MHRLWLRFLSLLVLVLPFIWPTLQVEAQANTSQATAKLQRQSTKNRPASLQETHTRRVAARQIKVSRVARAVKHTKHLKTVASKAARARNPSRHSRRRAAIPSGKGKRLARRRHTPKNRHSPLRLASKSVLVVDDKGQPVFSKAVHKVRPIASITKLMTAMVVLDAGVSLDETITICMADRDTLRHSRSRLLLGKATLPRGEMLKLALMSSENRAAAALGRTTFAGGTSAFVAAMNRKARALGMRHSHFADPTGLRATNVSTAADLVKLVRAARQYPLIREATTTPSAKVRPHPKRGALRYVNTNRLVQHRNRDWKIRLSKTGFINEAGRCLVMEAKLSEGTYDFVLLNAPGKLTPIGDSNRLRRWIENKGS